MENDLKSTQRLIEEKLSEISKEGNLDLLLLFSDEGLPMTQFPPSKYSREDIATISVLLNDSARVAETMNLSLKTDEASVTAHNKYKIVSRIFYVNETRFILLALVPPKVAYRRFTNKAVRVLSRIL